MANSTTKPFRTFLYCTAIKIEDISGICFAQCSWSCSCMTTGTKAGDEVGAALRYDGDDDNEDNDEDIYEDNDDDDE